MIAEGGNVDALLKALGSVIESKAVASALNAFSMAAILSSFIGVGARGVRLPGGSVLVRQQPGWLRQVLGGDLPAAPGALLAVPVPGFLVAIGYAGAVATLWTCIIPPLLAWKVRAARREEEGGEGFPAPGGLFMIVLVILFGVLTAAFHLLNMVDPARLQGLSRYPGRSASTQ